MAESTAAAPRGIVKRSLVPAQKATGTRSGDGLVDKVIEKLVPLNVLTDYGIHAVQRGDRLTACCPFHSEKTPSFHMSASSGAYHCKGCGAKGNLVGFIADMEKEEYVDILYRLADEFGLRQKRATPTAETVFDKVSRACAASLEASAAASNYLASRGVSRRTRELFGIGYCSGSELKSLSPREKEEAERTMLAYSTGTPSMTGRITFPIRNESGETVAMAGRVLDEKLAFGEKYINTRNTEKFTKSKMVYGFREALPAMRSTRMAIVVEGYFDVVVLHDQGVGNAVAVMGASGNEEIMRRLWAAVDTVVFCLDGDQAGREGVIRSALNAGASMTDGKMIRVLSLDDGVDPDQRVLSTGPEAFLAQAAAAEPLSSYAGRAYAEMCDLSCAEERARYVGIMKAFAAEFAGAPGLQAEIAREAELTAQAHAILAVAQRLGVDPEQLCNEADRVAARKPPSP